MKDTVHHLQDDLELPLEHVYSHLVHGHRVRPLPTEKALAREVWGRQHEMLHVGDVKGQKYILPSDHTTDGIPLLKAIR